MPKKLTQAETLRNKIKNKVMMLYPQRKRGLKLMVEIDRLCLLAVAERMGLKDDDVSLDPYGVADECL